MHADIFIFELEQSYAVMTLWRQYRCSRLCRQRVCQTR